MLQTDLEVRPTVPTQHLDRRVDFRVRLAPSIAGHQPTRQSPLPLAEFQKVIVFEQTFDFVDQFETSLFHFLPDHFLARTDMARASTRN